MLGRFCFCFRKTFRPLRGPLHARALASEIMSSTEYKFHVKASPDGKSLGDCPFSQRANLAFKVKGVKTTYVLIDLKNKPSWYAQVNPAGSVPAIEFGDQKIGDSGEILMYLEKTYPTPSLYPPGNDKAEEVVGQIFGVFNTWVKNNKDVSKAAELEANTTAELKKIDDFLGHCKGPLFCGDSWSAADCVFIPRIYHITTVLSHFLKYTKYEEMPNLKKYMDYAYSTPEFKATDYPREWILEGWAKYFQ